MAGVSVTYLLLLAVNGLILGLLWLRQPIAIQYKFLLLLFVLAIGVELCTSLFFEYLDNNLFFYHIYNPIEFSLYALFFASLPMDTNVVRSIRLTIPLFIAFAVVASIFIQPINENNGYVVIAESIILIFYSLLYLRHINIHEIERRAEQNPFFWITIGTLLFFTGTLFVEGCLAMLMNISGDVARFYYKLGFVFKYLTCILFLTGILTAWRYGAKR